jgi:hypothetical protein
MLPFGVTIPVTVPQRSEIPEGLMNNPVYTEQYFLMMASKPARNMWRLITEIK